MFENSLFLQLSFQETAAPDLVGWATSHPNLNLKIVRPKFAEANRSH